MRRLAVLWIASLYVGAAALAQTPEPQPEPSPAEQADRDCFGVSEVAGWGIIDSRTVRVRINSRRMYALTTDRSARALRWSFGMALTSPSGWICVGDMPAQARIHDVGQAVSHTWFVEEVRALPVGEAAVDDERPMQSADAR